MQKLTQDYLKECLHYDPETGRFTWLKRPLSHFATPRAANRTNSIYSGKQAGNKNVHGYVQICLYKQGFYGHRLAWLYMTGEWPDGEIDHINHDRSDNRFSNLRVVTRQENSQNASLGSKNTSGAVGVSKGRNGTWIAQICVDDERYRVGEFDDFEEALLAREIANEIFGFHENHGRAA